MQGQYKVEAPHMNEFNSRIISAKSNRIMEVDSIEQLKKIGYHKPFKVHENKRLLNIGTSEEVHILTNLLMSFRDHE